MRKKTKSSLKRIAAAALVLFASSGVVTFQPVMQNVNVVITASAADNYTYTLDGSVLTIEGTGSIPNSAFKNDNKKFSNVQTVIIGEGITSIGKQAFFKFTKLEKIVFSSTVTSISSNSFHQANNINTVYCFADPSDLDDNFFSYIPNHSSLNVYVRPDYVEAYSEKFGSVIGNITGDVSLVKMEKEFEAKEPTCTESGNIEYFEGNDGNYYKYDEENEEYVKIQQDQWIIPADPSKHDYVRSVCSRCGAVEEYTVTTVINDTTTTTDVVKGRTSVTVKAPAVNGKTFSYWKVNDVKASTSATFSFIVLENTTVTAVYDENVNAEPIVKISGSQTKYNNKNAVRFLFDRSVPKNYTVTEVGLLYGTNKLLGADTTVSGYSKLDLTKNGTAGLGSEETVINALKTRSTVKKFVGTQKQNDGTVDFAYAVGTNTDCYVYALGYVIVTNGTETKTIYSDVVATTYNNLIN